jgi:HAD superfamily hydrolase (TIGR01509 family)
MEGKKMAEQISSSGSKDVDNGAPRADQPGNFAPHSRNEISGLDALVFDFDGLIVNTELPGFVSWSELYQRFGATLTMDDWRHATGYVNAFDPGVHLENLLGRKLNWAELMPGREARNWELTLQAFTLPGIERLITMAKKANLPVAVASNSDYGWVDGGLNRLGLRHWIDAVVTRDMVVNPKPAPDVYLKAAQTIGVAPERTVALEDSEPGYRAAKNAGMKAVVIPNEFSIRQDLSAADLIVRSAEDLDLKRLNALFA